MSEKQIDLMSSPWRMLGLFLGSLAFVAVCLWIVTTHPEAGRRGAGPGSFSEFVAYIGIAFFGLTALVSGRRLFRTGPVVSVGPRGLYDRRLSTDWIPWDAIRTIVDSGMMDQRWAIVLFDPAREAPCRSGKPRKSWRASTRLSGSSATISPRPSCAAAFPPSRRRSARRGSTDRSSGGEP